MKLKIYDIIKCKSYKSNKLNISANKYEAEKFLTQYIKTNCVQNVNKCINLLLNEVTNELLKSMNNENK